MAEMSNMSVNVRPHQSKKPQFLLPKQPHIPPPAHHGLTTATGRLWGKNDNSRTGTASTLEHSTLEMKRRASEFILTTIKFIETDPVIRNEVAKGTVHRYEQGFQV